MEYIQIVAEFDLNANQPTMDNLEYIHIVAEFDLNESTGDDIKGN